MVRQVTALAANALLAEPTPSGTGGRGPYDDAPFTRGFGMGWDPAVLRKYNTTGHFRLINQLRSELTGNPLIRPKEGETVGAANRSRSLTRALQNRAQSVSFGRGRRPVQSGQPAAQPPDSPASPLRTVASAPPAVPDSADAANARSFRERLNAIHMR